MRPKHCRSYVRLGGCSHPEDCKFLHPPFCQKSKCKKGKDVTCPFFHWRPKRNETNMTGNASAGSSRAKATPSAPPPAKKTPSPFRQRIDEVERQLARIEAGRSWAAIASPMPPTPPPAPPLSAPLATVPVPRASPTPVVMAPPPPPPVPQAAGLSVHAQRQEELMRHIADGVARVADMAATLQAALAAAGRPASV